MSRPARVEPYTVRLSRSIEDVLAAWGPENALRYDRAKLVDSALEYAYPIAHRLLKSEILTGDQTHEIRVLVEGHVDAWIARSLRSARR